MQLREMDEQVTYMQQLQEDAGPIVLVNVFNVAPEDAERLVEAWADDAAFMKRHARLRLDPASPRHRRQQHVRKRGRVGVGQCAR